MNSGRFTTIFEVAIALTSLEWRRSWRLLFVVFFFFLSIRFLPSSGSSSLEVKLTIGMAVHRPKGHRPRYWSHRARHQT